MFERAIGMDLSDEINAGQKVVILYGPRQVGKTTLVKEVLSHSSKRFFQVNADEKKYSDLFSSRDLTKIQGAIHGYEGLFIDEAQRIPEIGLNLKLIHDSLPGFPIVVTGSSSFELANQVQEPLTGRAWSHLLFPMSVYEFAQSRTSFDINDQLSSLLIYGGYPEVASAPLLRQKERLLTELSSAYLYKDVLEILNLRKSEKLDDLLRLLAFQIGSQVSMSELARQLALSKETVSHYIDLLEKSFVVFRLRGFSRNLRNEVTKMDKIYFVDLGIRNAILGNFNPLERRDDVGKLWENFLISERLKTLSYTHQHCRPYFWRTHVGTEIDYVEETGSELMGYEFKWGDKLAKIPTSWKEGYPKAGFKTINRDNYLSFLSGHSGAN